MARIIHIDDPADPRIAAYRDIRERDLAGRRGLFIAEGKVVLNVLFSARRFEVCSALILENRLEGMAATLAAAPPDMPIYVADRAVMDTAAGFPIHRGVLAVAKRPAPASPDSLLPPAAAPSLVVGLVGISNHDNAGGIFRNAAAFGADAVLLDPTCCDPLYRKAIRVSVGGVLKIPFAVAPSHGEMVELLQRTGHTVLALTPCASARELTKVMPPRRVALLLGAEGEGLPADLMETLATVRIAMRNDFDSLNVAAASAIALHHFQHGD